MRPDRRWLNVQAMVLGTITISVVLAAGIAQLIGAVAGVADKPGFGIMWAVVGSVIVVMWLTAWPAVVLWYRNLAYAIEDDKVVVHKGILTKTQQNIPLRMITDFRLQRSLYERVVGIGSIQVQTAGQSQTATGYEAKLAGLAEWEELHADLRTRIKGKDDATGRPLDVDQAILEELRLIRRELERR